MSILDALFGGPGGPLQMPEMAGNMNFGQRLMSGSPLNSMINGPFPNAPGSKQGNRFKQAGSFLSSLPTPQPMQLAPMPQGGGTPDLATVLSEFLASRKAGG